MPVWYDACNLYWLEHEPEFTVCTAASSQINVLTRRELLLLLLLINITSPLVPQLLPKNVMLHLFKMETTGNLNCDGIFKKRYFVGKCNCEALQRPVASCSSPINTWWHLLGTGCPWVSIAGAAAGAAARVRGWRDVSPSQRAAISTNI